MAVRCVAAVFRLEWRGYRISVDKTSYSSSFVAAR